MLAHTCAVRLLLVSTFCFCSGCEAAAGWAVGAAAVTVVGAQTPSQSIEQTYYVGVFDPKEQIPPALYRLTVRGQASADGCSSRSDSDSNFAYRREIAVTSRDLGVRLFWCQCTALARYSLTGNSRCSTESPFVTTSSMGSLPSSRRGRISTFHTLGSNPSIVKVPSGFDSTFLVAAS